MGSFANFQQEPQQAFTFTEHATQRMHERGISQEAVDLAVSYGRKFHERGAMIFAIGRKEVQRYLPQGIDLVEQEGVQVVCNKAGGIMTVYRNRDFRSLRPRRRRMH